MFYAAMRHGQGRNRVRAAGRAARGDGWSGADEARQSRPGGASMPMIKMVTKKFT